MIADWKSRAQCRRDDVPTEFFFPLRDGEPDIVRERAAADYCQTCLVKPECLADAVEAEAHEPNSVVVHLGVAGGRTARERVADRKAARAAIARETA